MKVFVSVGDAVAVALLDTGSSHNFIDIGMARRAGLRLRERRNFSVAVANGDRVTSKGKALAQTVHIGGEAFVGDYDMVLGVQWLGTLGPVLWDFARRTVVFQRGDSRILWRGVDPMPGPSLAQLTAGNVLLDALLEEFAGLFAEPQGLPPRVHDDGSPTESDSSRAPVP
jgi:hypothetical protein